MYWILLFFVTTLLASVQAAFQNHFMTPQSTSWVRLSPGPLYIPFRLFVMPTLNKSHSSKDQLVQHHPSRQMFCTSRNRSWQTTSHNIESETSGVLASLLFKERPVISAHESVIPHITFNSIQLLFKQTKMSKAALLLK